MHHAHLLGQRQAAARDDISLLPTLQVAPMFEHLDALQGKRRPSERARVAIFPL
jgi:hypothetical protein